MPDDLRDPVRGAERSADLSSEHRHGPHHRNLLGAQCFLFVEDLVGHADLANVVHPRREICRGHGLRVEPGRGGEPPRDLRHSFRVRLGEVVFCFDRACKREHHLFGLNQRVVQSFDPEQRADASDELGLLDRLGEEVIGARLEGSYPVVDRAVRRDDHDRDHLAHTAGLDLTARLEPVHAGHLDVHQD